MGTGCAVCLVSVHSQFSTEKGITFQLRERSLQNKTRNITGLLVLDLDQSFAEVQNIN